MGIKKKVIAAVAAVATLGSLGIAASTAEAGTGWSALSDQEKNSSYGFFVWKSENAATQAEKDVAAKAANILKTAKYASYTKIGAEGDATSLDNFKESIAETQRINDFRAAQSDEPCRTDLQAGNGRKCNDASKRLTPLQANDILMAIAQSNANYSAVSMDHADRNDAGWNVAENLAWGPLQYSNYYAQIQETRIEQCQPGQSYSACNWYWNEKPRYDQKASGDGHYRTLTNKDYEYTLTGVGINSHTDAYGHTVAQEYSNDLFAEYNHQVAPVVSLSTYTQGINAYAKLVRKIAKVSVNPTTVTVAANKNASTVDLSSVKATVTYNDNTSATATVKWNNLSQDQLAILHSRKGGNFTVNGTIDGSFDDGVSNTVSVTVNVTPASIASVALSENEVTVPSGTDPKDALAGLTATATWSNGETSAVTVAWDKANKADYSKREGGDIAIHGAVDGYAAGVDATVHVTPATIETVKNPGNITYVIGSAQTPQYPTTVNVTYSNGDADIANVVWNTDAVKLDQAGKYVAIGTIDGTDKKASLTVNVIEATIDSFENPAAVTVDSGKSLDLSGTTVRAKYSNGSTMDTPVRWNKLTKAQQDTLDAIAGGDFTVEGTVQGAFTDANTSKTAKVKVHVNPARVSGVVIKGTDSANADVQFKALKSEAESETALRAQLPTTAAVSWTNHSETTDAAIVWSALTAKQKKILQSRQGGSFDLTATVQGETLTAHITIAPATAVKAAAPASKAITVEAKSDPTAVLPQTTEVEWSNGDTTNSGIAWNVPENATAKRGTKTITGTVEGLKVSVKLEVTARIVSVAGNVDVTVSNGVDPTGKLPKTVQTTWSDDEVSDAKVTWDAIEKSAYTKREANTFTVQGSVEGTTQKAVATVHVEAATITKLHAPAALTYVIDSADQPVLPATVKADYSNGDTNIDVAVASWDGVGGIDYTKAGTYTLTAHVDGTAETVAQKIIVTAATIDSVSNPAAVTIDSGAALTLPNTVSAKMSNGQNAKVAVQWNALTAAQQNTLNALAGGDFEVEGTVQGTFTDANASKTVKVKVHVKPAEVSKVVLNGTDSANTDVQFKALKSEAASEAALRAQLPTTATVSWSNHAETTDAAIVWSALTAEQKKVLQSRQGGAFDLTATVQGETLTAHVTVAPASIESVANVEDRTVIIGTTPAALPGSLKAAYSNGDTDDVAVTWNDAVDYTKAGDYTLEGTVNGYAGKPTMLIHVVEPTMTKHDAEFKVTTKPGVAPQLPATASTSWNNGQTITAPIAWNEVAADAYAKGGATFDVAGTYTVNGQTIDVVAHVTVENEVKPEPEPDQPTKPDQKPDQKPEPKPEPKPDQPTKPAEKPNQKPGQQQGSNTQNGKKDQPTAAQGAQTKQNKQSEQATQQSKQQQTASTGSNVLWIAIAVVVLVIAAVCLLVAIRKKH